MDDMSRTLSSSVVVIQDADMKPFKRPGDIVFRQWRTVIAMFLGMPCLYLFYELVVLTALYYYMRHRHEKMCDALYCKWFAHES